MQDLKCIETIEIAPTAPFDFDTTFHKPDHFPSTDNYWEPGVKWQTYFWENNHIGLKFVNSGTKYKPRIDTKIYSEVTLSKSFVESLRNEIIYRYNLDINLIDFYEKFRENDILKNPIKKFEGMRPGHAGSLYEYLIIGIVLQNTFVKRSVQMLQTLFEHYGELLHYDNKVLYAFWKPGSLEKITETELRNLKLGYRAKSIKRVDEAFRSAQINEVELRKNSTYIQEKEMLKLYGIGPATVWYVLFDVFHNWDSFHHISPWEQKIYSKLFFNVEPGNPVSIDKIMNYFESFIPYRQLAIHYIWEDLWWKRKNEQIAWLEKLIRL